MKDIEKIETILKAVGLGTRISEANEIQLGGIFYLMPDVPNDLNAIRELELLVIETVGRIKHGEALEVVLGLDQDLIPYVCDSLTATADAKTKIAAMLAALEAK